MKLYIFIAIIVSALTVIIIMPAIRGLRGKTIVAGTSDVVRSPNGEFTAIFAHLYGDGGEERQIWIVKTKDFINYPKRKILLSYNYDRRVSILWSPDSGKILINDFAGSDFSEIHLFKPDKNMHFIEDEDLGQLLENKITMPILNNTETYHLYPKAEEWIDNNTFIVHLEGFGGGAPKIDAKYKVNIETKTVTEIK